MKTYQHIFLQIRTWLLVLLVLMGIGKSTDMMAQKKEIKIAMAQIFTLDGDRAGNFQRIQNAIRESKAQNADIVVFPESCLLGWVNPAAHQLARAIPGEDSEQLCSWARQYKIFICIGLDEKDGDQLFDTALLISDEGKILLKHRKINVLPELMTPPYSVGNEVIAIPTKFGKIGVMICADSFQEDVLDRMKTNRPDLLLIPYGWAADEKEWPEHAKELTLVVQHAAKKVGCPVVGTDAVGQISGGPWRGKTYGGQSVAADKSGTVLAIGKDRDRDVKIVSVTIQ